MVLEEIFTGLVGLITTSIAEYAVSPVKRHILYAFKSDSQFQGLEEVVVQLKNKKDRLEKSVTEATRSGEQIFDNVTAWLNNVEKAIDEAEQIIQGKDEAQQKCCSGSCPNLKTRYQLSKKADKKGLVISKLVQEAEGLNPISFRSPLEPIVEPSVYAQEALASRVQILDQIIDALKDPNLNMIGVYGMGGVGKTTLAKEVQGKAMQDKMFENVILVAVSQTPELRRIQSEIADFLGLRFDAEELPGRASQLYKRLQESKVLIILDDIWQKLDLNAVGIPTGDSCEGCKLLLTSRRMDVLITEMGAQKEFLLGTLGEEDAWKLFQTIAKKAVDPQFHSTATEVSKKCAGLPLLIIIVANELKNKELYEWTDMLDQLSVTGNEDIYEKVHKVLEKSFDKLPGEELKSLFLLCSMFAQSNIEIQLLLIYGISLGILKNRISIQQARNRLLTLINKLKADCLLLDGDKYGFVKMHDVVRDSAISIASRLQHAFVGSGQISLREGISPNCTKLSIPYCDVRELPGDLECPQADLFLLFTEDLCLEMPDSFFKGLRKLKAVDFTGMRLATLPSSLGLLPNLHTLSLQRCRLNSIDVIGQLKQLQMLSLSGSKIVELPREIEELTQLKLLNLSNCTVLRVIPTNVLMKLCLLEELYMLNSFDRWDTKDNVSLVELEGLSHLSTLEIQIVNPKLIPRGFRFFDGLQLDSFKISIGVEWSSDGKYEKSNKIILKLEPSVQLGQRIEGLLRGAEDLSLDGAWGVDLNLENCPRLKHLRIENDSGNIQHLIKFKGRASFQILESLFLNSLKSLEKICDDQVATGSFEKLQKLNVSNCHKLKSLFPISSAKCMSQLQELELKSCDSVEAVVGDCHYDNDVIELTQLNSMELRSLPNLKCFRKIEAGTAQMKLLFDEMVSFPNLTSLVVYECKNLNYIFTTSMVKCLGQLKMLKIKNCESVEEIVLVRQSEESIDKIVFPKLDNLQLKYHPNLKRFCYGHLLEFPSLKTLIIDDCPAMENFVSKFSSKRDNDGSDGYFFNELVTLSNLERLEAHHLNSSRYLWDEKFIAGDSFCKLLSLHIGRCPKLQVIFPSNVYRRFQRLERLYVLACNDVKEIYQYEGVGFEDDNNAPTFALQKLDIRRLQSLMHIWSKDFGGYSKFRSLQSVSICDCENLEYVFPESIASDLVQLQQPRTSECGVEMIISKSSEDCPASFEFPELTTVELIGLHKMRKICERPQALELPKLKTLQLYDCDDLWLQESITFVERFIPNLEELKMDDQGFNAIHESGASPVEFFSNLKKVVVTRIHTDSFQFLSGFLQRLNSVETLVFEGGSIYSESLFDDEKAVGEKEHHSRLTHLELWAVHRLKHIVKKESPLNSILHHLQTLDVYFCEDLMDIAPSSTSFHNLTALNIFDCSKMTKLLTSSTAETMVQLVHMRVAYCKEIEEIIAIDADCIKREVINFSKLKCLELLYLDKISLFCFGHCTFCFPLLERVIVKGCPQMKSFCCGVLSTPKLRGITFDDEQQWEGDLNATIASQLRQWVGVHFGEWKISQNIESVEVVKDAFSSKVLSANQILFLHRLKKIIVKDCELVEVVFDLERLRVENGHVGMLPKLEELHLVNLPWLSNLCNKPPAGVLEFNKLTKLEIENCGRLEYAFTWSMASCLFQLQTIELRNCEQMERVIKGEEADGASTVVFHSLTTVVLESLPKFSGFYSGNDDLECPSLEKISMRECPIIKGFISRLLRDEGNGKNIHFSYKVFPSLNELTVDIKTICAILQVEFPKNFLSSVKSLVLRYCSVKTAGSHARLLHFLSRLPYLDELVIDNSSLDELYKFKQLNILDEAMTLPQITSLKLENVANAKHIWTNLVPFSTSFQNVTALEVYRCDQLVKLMTTSVARSMVQLENLRVKRCDVLMEIIGDENDPTEHIVFTKMKTLQLSKLHRLQSFSSGHCAFQFPCLKNVDLKRCPNMKIFCAGTLNAPKLFGVEHSRKYERKCYWKGDINATIQQLYMEMAGFDGVDDVKLSIFPLLKEKWSDQISCKHFHSLKKLVVDDCALLRNAIPPLLLRQLHLLQELKVEKCEALEQVFGMEGLNAYECRSKRLTKLNQLQLLDLPSLRQVWNKDPHQVLSFRNLRLLEIQNCGKLTYVFDLSMALRLPRLEQVEVKNCNLVEHIIVKAEEDPMQEYQKIFPSLQSISLQHLTSLSSFYSTTGIFECPSLKMIEVVQCPNMELFPSSFANGQQISSDDANSTLALMGNQIAIPGLEELKVEWDRLKPIVNDHSQPEFLSRLKLIDLTGLLGEYRSLPPNFIQLFPKLEKLSFSDALIEEINLHELSSLEGDDPESITLLTKLKFSKLPKLKQLVCDDFPQVTIFQNLEGLEVAECSSLKLLFPSSVSFQNLTNLQVSNCDGIINLITSSTARSLVQLKKMEVKECKMMEEIIAVGSDGGEHEIRFSQLECLELVDLPCLESFCSGESDVNFPSLYEVVVIGCPNMKKFACSVTPKLKKVKTGRLEYEWEWEGNLDNTIRALYSEKDAEESEPRVCDQSD